MLSLLGSLFCGCEKNDLYQCLPSQYRLLRSDIVDFQNQEIGGAKIFFRKDATSGKLLKIRISDNSIRTLAELDSTKQKNGDYFEFNRDCSISVRGYFKNGRMDSTWISYYENGNRNKMCKYLFGKVSGDYIQYDSSGSVTIYNLMAPDSLSEYTVRYDFKGNVVSELGYPYFMQLDSSNEYVVGEKIKVNIFIANPPHMSATLRMDTLQHFIPNSATYVTSLYRPGIYYCEFIFSEPGDYNIPTPIKFDFLDGKIILATPTLDLSIR